jgi:hypothetical protein
VLARSQSPSILTDDNSQVLYCAGLASVTTGAHTEKQCSTVCLVLMSSYYPPALTKANHVISLNDSERHLWRTLLMSVYELLAQYIRVLVTDTHFGNHT